MGRLGGVHDFPVIGLENLPLRLRQATVGIVDDEARPKRHEGGIDMDRIGVAGKIHGMDAVVGKMTLQPFHGPAVGGESMLAEQVLAKAHDVGRVEQRFGLRGHEIQRGGALQPLLDGDVVKIARLV